MSATRTQIYLSEEQRRLIDRLAKSRGVTIAAVVRSALDAYLTDDPDPSAATFGAVPDATAPSWDEWDRG